MERNSANSAPMLWLATATAAGCALGTGSPWPWIGGLVVVALAASRRTFPRSMRFALWLFAFFLAGAGMRAAAEQAAGERQAQAIALSAKTNARFESVVEKVVREYPAARIVVRVRAARSDEGEVPFEVRALLTLPPGLAPPDEGRTLLFHAALHRARGSQFPGDFDAARALASRGIELTASVPGPNDLAVLPADHLGPIERAIYAARAATRRLVRTALPEDAAALTEAFVIGDSPLLDEPLRQPFDAAGASHLLAVSGLQATLLAALLFAFVRFLWGRSRFLLGRADPGPAAAAICLPMVFAYGAYAGGAASVMRSAWMAAALMLAQMLRRKGALAQTLGAAALAMMMLEPRILDDVGFLLSFLSVLALALIAPGMTAALAPAAIRASWQGQLAGALAASFAAWLATVPLVAHLFGRVATWGGLTNLLLIPAGAVALPPIVVGAIAATALDLHWLMQLVGAASLSLMDLCKPFAALPHAVVEIRPAPSLALVGLGLAGALACGLPSRRWLAGGCVMTAVSVAGSVVMQPGRDGSMRVLMAPVGQGDGSIVLLPDGSAAVIDGGGSFVSSVDPGKTVMLPILRELGVKKLALAILSHPHPDHQNGLVTLVRELRPDELWWSGESSGHPRFRALMDAAREAGTVLVGFGRRGEQAMVTREIGGARFTVLHPLPRPADTELPYFPELEANDNSLVVRISHGNTHVLFPGDVEAEAERMLTSDPNVRPLLRADVLKIPHHGSITSTTEAFLDAVAPRHALVGVGAGNQWGFPHPDVMARLHQRGVDVWRTDEDGLITVELDGTDVRAHAFRR